MAYGYASSQPGLGVWLILAAGLIERMIIAFWLNPGFDEAYYFLYTLHPALSYFDHPPLVAWITALGPWLLGGAVSGFSIRLGSVLLYTGSLFWLYQTGRQLFGRRAGFFTLVIASIIPIFQVGFGVLTLPDSPLLFFWTAALSGAAAEFFPRRSGLPSSFSESGSYQPTWRLALISGWVGLACLGKYHGFGLGFGLVLFCALTPRFRPALASFWTLLGVGLFGLALSPILLWNGQHDWISLRFQSGRAVPASGFSALACLGAWGMGVGFLFPSLGIPLWWVTGRALLAGCLRPLRALRPTDTQLKQGLILSICLPVVLGFTLMGGYRQVLPTWPMPGFWGITLLLGYQADRWWDRWAGGVRRWLMASAVMVTCLLSLGLLHVSAGILQKPNSYPWEGVWAIADDPSTQLIDIEQLRAGFSQDPVLANALQSADFVITNHYFLAGQVAMALTPISQKPITCFSPDPRGFAFWSQPQQWLGQNALYITSRLFQDRPESDPLPPYANYFERVEPIGEIPLRRAGEIVQTFLVYQATYLQHPYLWPTELPTA
ncbi:MAG: glycosyltransferase family 39 protein [Cyanobacteriota bacterium]|nr:glycosyltransferase family 39 protein [Cyanobacteriota bacterium]